MATAEAHELVLDDIDGRPFRLSALRGQRLVLVAWATHRGCRFDLPGWQAPRTELHHPGVEVVTVSLEAAAPEHPSLLDPTHQLGALFGVVNIPTSSGSTSRA